MTPIQRPDNPTPRYPEPSHHDTTAPLAPSPPDSRGRAADRVDDRYCLVQGLTGFDQTAWAEQPPPWAPGRREDAATMERNAAAADKTWCIAEVDIFCDLSPDEMEAIAEATPRKTYTAGEILYSPHKPVEALFILKQGRVRIFRISTDGRALTTAIITPGTIFGEMVLVGQRMYGSYAEVLDDSVVCVMNRADVHRFLLADPRISARITEILGKRLVEMEQRLSDTVFKNVPQRIATTLATLSAEQRRMGVGPGRPVVALTHDQIAALVGTSRETATKILGDLAARGYIRLSRGRITILDPTGLDHEAG